MKILRPLAVPALTAFLGAGCASVPPQHVGVLETFGKVHDTTWAPGLHAWAPWLGVHRVNCRTRQIEAQGIADFQRIVTAGISPALLTWKGIEATEHLATSSNSKIIVVGGKNGLPVILNP